MQGDRILPIAILDRSLRPQRLYFYRCRKDGIKHSDSLPVYPAGSAKPCEPAWCYEVHGNMLHVRPSLLIRTTIPDGDKMKEVELFHNEGFWTVQFEDGRAGDLAEPNSPK